MLKLTRTVIAFQLQGTTAKSVCQAFWKAKPEDKSTVLTVIGLMTASHSVVELQQG